MTRRTPNQVALYETSTLAALASPTTPSLLQPCHEKPAQQPKTQKAKQVQAPAINTADNLKEDAKFAAKDATDVSKKAMK